MTCKSWWLASHDDLMMGVLESHYQISNSWGVFSPCFGQGLIPVEQIPLNSLSSLFCSALIASCATWEQKKSLIGTLSCKFSQIIATCPKPENRWSVLIHHQAGRKVTDGCQACIISGHGHEWWNSTSSASGFKRGRSEQVRRLHSTASNGLIVLLILKTDWHEPPLLWNKNCSNLPTGGLSR